MKAFFNRRLGHDNHTRGPRRPTGSLTPITAINYTDKAVLCQDQSHDSIFVVEREVLWYPPAPEIHGGGNVMRTLLLSLILTGLLWGGGPVASAQSRDLAQMVNKPAPNFDLTLFSGKQIQLKDFNGHVLVLNFWHSG